MTKNIGAYAFAAIACLVLIGCSKDVPKQISVSPTESTFVQKIEAAQRFVNTMLAGAGPPFSELHAIVSYSPGREKSFHCSIMRGNKQEPGNSFVAGDPYSPERACVQAFMQAQQMGLLTPDGVAARDLNKPQPDLGSKKS